MRFVDFGNTVRLNIYYNEKEKYLDNTVVVHNFKDKSEGQLKQELIHDLIELNAQSGWYTFYLYETKKIVYSVFFIKKDRNFDF